MALTWRPMSRADIADVIAIAAIVHPGYPEDDAVLAERLALYPKGCFVLELDGAPAGYLLSHPWLYGHPPALNALLGKLPEPADTYYLHDIALLPHAQGQGAARAALELARAAARQAGQKNISLCAVNGSHSFWQAHGFADAGNDGLEEKLKSYGGEAFFMRRDA